ncbi:MAG TPA: hypothetical protein VKB93_01280 [Thermoanaerobaculia bacterium]|nr:hypothetical protein [Thermoanaerobaculia bacterium]
MPKQLTSWTIEVLTGGGIAPSMRTSIALRSSGAATLLDYRGDALCSGSATAGELAALAARVAEARPDQWAASYARAENPNGCCDQIGTRVKLTRVFGDVTVTNETFWFDDHPPLPADLTALHAAAFGEGSPRARLEPACRNEQALKRWTIEITEEGGVAYRYHRVALDSGRNVYIQPNVRTNACRFTLDESEAEELSALVRSADAAGWAASYARADNPNGCCDQILTKVRLIRGELGPNGVADVTYTTQWFSDHPPLPSDLEELHARLVRDVFQRFGAQCGPLF